MKRTLILASTSPYRRALLDRLGLSYQAVAPLFEEHPSDTCDPEGQIIEFARGKALSLAKRFPKAIIIGSDQGLVSDSMLIGKPGDHQRATAQLQQLSGRCHSLVTALAVFDAQNDRLLEAVDHHLICFRELSPMDIEAYLQADEPYDCAGTFKIESLGIALFDKVEGKDPSAIEGMPLIALCTLLSQLGYSVLSQG